MKSKFSILILISALALLALCGIQAYLINNTYQLKKKAFMDEADRAVTELPDQQMLDSIYDTLIEVDLENHLIDYLNARITKRQAIDRFYRTADVLNKQFAPIYKSLVEELNLGYELRFSYELESIVLYDYPNTDTIFDAKYGGRNRMLGEKLLNGERRIMNNSRTFDTNQYVKTVGEEIVTSSYDFEVRTRQLIQIPHWKTIVLKRMWVLIVGSIILFIFVIGLLYYSIKNLITQKNIAEVKTDFINNVTHELKTPLATLSIATKSLRSDLIKDNSEAFDNTLGIIERQNTRLQKLIDQVLTNSLSAEELQLNKEQISDTVFLNDLISDFETATQHSDLSILNEVYNPEVFLRIDRFHLTTALLNVLENAVKYGKEKVRINLRTTLQNGQYIITIIDNGTGISEKDQQSIFDKFYRAGNSNVHNVKGLGLGLYFTYQIIKAHNGIIFLESTPGQGTTFTIKLPI